jgi:hypothetical protein
MKTKLLLFLFLFVSSLSYGQMQDLATLAEGKMVYGSVLYDSDDNVYGYLYLYERDVNKTDKKMEYVFLDKNLNKVSNTTFTDKLYDGVSSRYYDCTLMGDFIILNKTYYFDKKFLGAVANRMSLLNTFQIISLKDNTVSSEYKYENEEFIKFIADYDKMKQEYKEQMTKYIIYGFNNASTKGFFIFDIEKDKNYLSKELKFYNEKMEPVWSYRYNPDGTKNDYKAFRFLNTKNNTIYLSETRFEKNLCIEYKIVALDFQTGKKIYEYVMETSKCKYSHTVIAKEVNGQLIISGNYSPYNQKYGFSLDKNLGFYKIMLNQQGKEIQQAYTKWNDFKQFIDINQKGRVEKNYRLRLVRDFFFKDGTISVLTEKYNPLSTNFWTGVTAPKSDDYVVFNMNRDFTVNDVKVIEKASTLGYYRNYLFSQYIKDDTGVVFFFQNYDKNDETKEKQWFLGINTILGGKLTQEKIPISSKKKYVIEPAPAKEGYIMLREYNEKEKYNQIRLEKLNY